VLEYMEALVRNPFGKVTLLLIANNQWRVPDAGRVALLAISDGAMQPLTLPVGNDKGSG
jgi:hypothetical protein